MAENIRIKTQPNGTDKYVSLKIDQDFDFIEILSLKISQDKVYNEFCSDYGVIAGRVTVNNGFGVPNAKVSVFIPISDEDKENVEISGLYPYETVNDKNSDGIRYNLLPKESDSQDDCYTPIGTFPTKREILDNPVMSEIYCKYYRYTTQTNHAGDFMLFGVPVGNHTVHIDADISNIGVVSQRPYDLIEQGAPQKLFYSPTKFKDSTNLNTLPQVKSTNIGVNVRPFWGNPENCEIGINRLDYNLDYFVRPAALFVGSFFGDARKNSVSKRCRPRKDLGKLCEQQTSEGTVEMIRKTPDNEIEEFSVEGGRVVDENGTWAYQIPMNLDNVVTDEYGNIVPSEDENIGIPTKANVRFRISMDESGGNGRLRTRGKYLVPNNPSGLNDLDFTFDNTTKDNSFATLYWNKIYTVKNFIPKIQRAGLGRKSKAYTGIKNVDNCPGDKTPFPFNRVFTKGNILFTIICFIVTLITNIVALINTILCAIKGIKIVGWYPFDFINPITMTCPDDPEKYFNPGCYGDVPENYIDCVSALLAEQLGLFQFDFYNDWVNGTLYMYLLKYKKRRRSNREKFCETYCDDYQGGTRSNTCKTNQISDTTVISRDDNFTHSFRNGLLVKFDNELYYPPILLDGTNRKMFATDLTNLGAVLDCDWQGFPKIIQYVTDTSYKIPPLVQEEPEPGDIDNNVTTGMFQIGNLYTGLFFDIGCRIGVTFNADQATNIRRLCELSVDIPESEQNQPAHKYVTIEEIYDPQDTVDTLTSANRYVRDTYALLNIAGSGINSYPPIPATNLDLPQNGSSFNINGDVGPLHSNGSLYNAFRDFRLSPSAQDMAPLTSNSYYMYFGIMPGKGGIEKLKSKYFTTCIPAIVNEFIIDTTVTNTTINGAANGIINFIFVGGTAPFTYTWTGPNYTFGPQTTTSSGNITRLVQGTYTITATDSNGSIVVKTVIVGGPVALACSVNLNAEPLNISTNDGSILFSFVGGVSPYRLVITNSLGTTTSTYNTPVSANIPNIPAGLNTFTITDSSNPVQTCTRTIDVPTAPPLTLSIPSNRIGNVACLETNNGSISPVVSGGSAPYTVNAVGPNGYNTTIQYGASSFTNLFPGTYTLTATDSANQSQTQTVTITKITFTVTYVITKIPAPPGPGSGVFDEWSVRFLASNGVEPYDYGGSNPRRYITPGLKTVTVTDDTGCEVTVSFRLI